MTIVNYLQYFEIKVKQPFYDEKKSLNNYILNQDQNHVFMTKQILNNYEMLGQNLERGAVKYSPLNK